MITCLHSGIGRALAANFVRSGDNVVISSRSGTTDPASFLTSKYPLKLTVSEAQCACCCVNADDKVKATVAELTALSKNKDFGAVKVSIMLWHQTNASAGLSPSSKVPSMLILRHKLNRRGVMQGRACNMTKPAQVASLANFAHAELGSIDLW